MIAKELCEMEKSVLEIAAKYICNSRDGLCPMVVEGFSCKKPCAEDTLPWCCWVEMFREQLREREKGKAS
ncbi:MAG: hypothetical protein KKG47_12510 [Proteobacteria bacterium]|nr:hypothetical protein [Pseudomonadota bacterium]MBU1739214.1 hypothetical protein [Pseudomonadota bacterium]